MLNVGFEAIPLEKVRDNSFILVGSRYRQLTSSTNSKYDFYSLKDVCKIIAGQSPSSKNYNDNEEGLPFYQGNVNFDEVYIKPPTIWTTEITKEAMENDILISVRAPVGAVNICNNHICIGRGLIALRATDKINYKYLFYIMKFYGKNILKNLSLGSTFEAVTKSDVENFAIPIPSIEEQNEIVAEIESYQQKILEAKQIIEILNEKINKTINDVWE